MNTVKSLLILLCLFIFSCGKNDKSEYVDDKKPEQNNSQDKNDNKNNSTEQNKSSDKTTENPADNKSSQGNSNDKSFNRDDKPVAVITALEAKDYLGKVVTVKGFVADIYKSEKVAYLNFIEKYPENPFTAVIFANKFSDFGDINRYKGKNVEVTGRVSVFNKKPQVILNSESQIKVSK